LASISADKITALFDLPLHNACKELGIGSTAFKSLCRTYGIKKWPYRQMRKLRRRERLQNRSSSLCGEEEEEEEEEENDAEIDDDELE